MRKRLVPSPFSIAADNNNIKIRFFPLRFFPAYILNNSNFHTKLAFSFSVLLYINDRIPTTAFLWTKM